jgi:hypothetical protein
VTQASPLKSSSVDRNRYGVVPKKKKEIDMVSLETDQH